MLAPSSSGLKSKPSKASFACCQLQGDFLFGLLFNPEDGGNMFTFNGLHSVISQKTELLKR
jgi:hypothetical protein